MKKILNIYVDETGDFGYENGASMLYGISFVFYETNSNSLNVKKLEEKLNDIGCNFMIHMSNLIGKRNECANFSLNKRKRIFNIYYQFIRNSSIKYHTIIINKNYTDTYKILKNKMALDINKMINDNIDYFSKFDKVIMYYDNGQQLLGKVIDNIFTVVNNFEHIIDFNHKKEKLFQVADALTFIDKLKYKVKNNIALSKSEKLFFEKKELKKILKELDKKRI